MVESTLGWIGCGRMGTAMAARLVRAGHDVTVTNRTRAKAEVLGELGASVVDTPRDLAGRDVVFIMVSANDDLIEVTSGPHGVLADPERAPKIIVDCSTVSTETSADVRAACAARGAVFLAAPVSGNPKVVAAGELTLAVSGTREAFDVVKPYLDELGKGATYVGDGEVARLVKICHNIVLGVVTQCLAEVTVLAEKGGVRRSAFLEFINGSVMGSMFSRYKTPAFVNLDFKPTFTPVLLKKDFDLGMAEAKHLGVAMPVAALCTEIVKSSIGAGYVSEDFAVLLLEAARSAGLELVAENVTVDDGLGAAN
ncbi:MAG: NAD(P)-dependent oxidoreductase [Acidobacteriota bacterium]|nr:NAD(P)-dependent oxidoreductase [Acidobacteriota bacterium]MDE3043539.1 NAD(P)-dependent oxidoreductase [Acidobacteriota bacterium]MDE3106642.1 NAD(P)-dependent oxidoreductase [Acidobacteriota bacterium]MDE3222545.1 NAD(P)-dependent oxidoreductase [Acidobacteriota bacterium]